MEKGDINMSRYSRTNISMGGIQPYPVRGDIGGGLAREINSQKSSRPLRKYMANRIMALRKRAGEDGFWLE